MSEALELCRELVRFKTDENNVGPALEYLLSVLKKAGFSGKITDIDAPGGQKVGNLFATAGSGGRHLLFSGHMDVVPAGDFSGWKYPPFDAVVVDGVLYGRGIADMKGGTACFAAAAKKYLASGGAGRISLLISGDEEEPLVDGTDKMLERLSARGEKFDFCLVGEPSNPRRIGEEIKIGRRGDIVLKITSYGEAGHTAYPHLAVNPIHNLVTLLAELTRSPLDNGNEFFDPSTLQITTVDVGNPASNVIPAEAFAQIDIRFNSSHSGTSIVRWVEEIISRAPGRFKLDYEIAGEAFLSKISPDVEKLSAAVRKVSGIQPEYSTKGGTSDARFVKKYCPVVEFGLTNGSIHKTNECETVENIEKLTNIYFEFIKSFFA